MKAIVKFLFVFVIFFFSWGVCVDKLYLKKSCFDVSHCPRTRVTETRPRYNWLLIFEILGSWSANLKSGGESSCSVGSVVPGMFQLTI